MDQISNIFFDCYNWIIKDFKQWPLRFCAELFAWACSVISAIIFAATVPDVPTIPLYSIFISGCVASAWTCWTRGSFGLLANYIFLITIDSFGLIRYIVNS